MQHWDALNKYQHELLSFFGSHRYICEYFYFAGGTNLVANYFGHRISDDIDMFCDTIFDAHLLHTIITKEFVSQYGIKHILYKKIYDRYQYDVYYDGGFCIKLEFVKYFPHQFDLTKDTRTGLLFESLHDCFLNKLMCVYERDDGKDLVDLYEICSMFPIYINDKDIYIHQKFGTKISDYTLGMRMFEILNKVKVYPKLLRNYTVQDVQNFSKNFSKELGSKSIY